MSLENIVCKPSEILEATGLVKGGMSRKQKLIVGGTMWTAGATALATAAFLTFFPDRTDLADEWASEHGLDYTNLCYTPNPETETKLNTYNDRYNVAVSTFRQLEQSGPIGRGLNQTFIEGDTIFCFGPRHESGDDVHKQGLGRELYFTADDLGEADAKLASYLFESRGLEPYVQDHVKQREKHYITSAAFLWNRSIEAVKAVIHVDATHTMLQAKGAYQIFEHEQWRDLAERPNRVDAVRAFQDALNEEPYNKKEARRSAFMAAYHSAAVQSDTDVPFLQWYAGEVDEQPEARSRLVPSMCLSTNGDMSPCMRTEYYTVYVDPPRYVHSEDIHPATLVALSDIFMDGEPFLSKAEAEALIIDSETPNFHSDKALSIYKQAESNARDYAQGNFSGEKVSGRGFYADIDMNGYE